jgi:hypothetical protein
MGVSTGLTPSRQASRKTQPAFARHFFDCYTVLAPPIRMFEECRGQVDLIALTEQIVELESYKSRTGPREKFMRRNDELLC